MLTNLVDQRPHSGWSSPRIVENNDIFTFHTWFVLAPSFSRQIATLVLERLYLNPLSFLIRSFDEA
jgi:hypothetical protein